MDYRDVESLGSFRFVLIAVGAWMNHNQLWQSITFARRTEFFGNSSAADDYG